MLYLGCIVSRLFLHCDILSVPWCIMVVSSPDCSYFFCIMPVSFCIMDVLYHRLFLFCCIMSVSCRIMVVFGSRLFLLFYVAYIMLYHGLSRLCCVLVGSIVWYITCFMLYHSWFVVRLFLFCCIMSASCCIMVLCPNCFYFVCISPVSCRDFCCFFSSYYVFKFANIWNRL